MKLKMNFDFYKHRYIFMAISGVLLIAGLVGGIVNGGLNYDIQFEGGTQLEIPMQADNFETNAVQNLVSDMMNKSITAQKQEVYNPDSPGAQETSLVIKASKSEVMDDEQISILIEILNTEYGIREGRNVSIRTVEPYIGAEMLQKGLAAIFITATCILLYVCVRFSVMSGWSAAVCATLGLLHDVLIMLSFYTVFQLPVNDSFIAAILTMLGYSINDTIVVYDRIRENAKKVKKNSYVELVNTSLNQTFTRTLNTTITTLIAVLTVYVFAIRFDIGSLKEFCLPIIVGLISGVYSTLFIAAQTWAMWQNRKLNRKVAGQQAAK